MNAKPVLGIRCVGCVRYYCYHCKHFFGVQQAGEKEIPFIEWNYCPHCGTRQLWASATIEYATNNTIHQVQ